MADGEPERLQELLTGRKGLQLEIAGEQTSVLALLQAVPDVLSVRPLRSTGENQWEYQLDYPVGKEIRPAVYHALKQTSFDLLMMKAEEISLESIYLKITEDQEEEHEDRS